MLDFSGADRSVERVKGHHVVLTTYGTLRRDALLLKDVEFEYAIVNKRFLVDDQRNGTVVEKVAA